MKNMTVSEAKDIIEASKADEVSRSIAQAAVLAVNKNTARILRLADDDATCKTNELKKLSKTTTENIKSKLISDHKSFTTETKTAFKTGLVVQIRDCKEFVVRVEEETRIQIELEKERSRKAIEKIRQNCREKLITKRDSAIASQNSSVRTMEGKNRLHREHCNRAINAHVNKSVVRILTYKSRIIKLAEAKATREATVILNKCRLDIKAEQEKDMVVVVGCKRRREDDEN